MLIDESWTPAGQMAIAEHGHVRGPLRPDQLLSVRRRNAVRLRSHMFRSVDMLLIATATVVTIIRTFDVSPFQTSVAESAPFVLGGFVLARCLRSLSVYSFGRSERFGTHVVRLVVAAAIGCLVAFATDVIVRSGGPSLWSITLWGVRCAAGLAALHVVWASFVAQWRRTGWLTPNVVIVGATAHAEDLIRATIARRDLHLLGIFDDRRERSPLSLLGVPVLGDIAALHNHKITPYVDLIVVAVDMSATNRIRQINQQLSVLPNKVTLIVDQDGHTAGTSSIRQLADAPLAPLNVAVDSGRRAFAKRIQDLVISIPMTILISPLLAAIALAVRLDSPGPVLFRQRRHGFNNEAIVVWKFRTMRQDATDATAAQQVIANDDRVTRIGRILRKTGFDELPQLFNVITGEMSLVGPRPHAIGMKTGSVESARLVGEYAHRHRIKPGMTGWAAVNGSRGPLEDAAAVSRRVALDIEYIERQSFWLDLWIMIRTIPSMLGDRSAVR
ncbi:MAG: Undecaprenyl-phosphate glucose phosphotransferase [Ilumatobacteraceae bacterium]|nr:Undecaprenyl-phosphate glucose phosphotransferase [Ilumatobacteraceae bacterium]